MARKTEETSRQLILPTKQTRSRERTQRIIEAGLKLLQDHNFEDLHVEKIAEEAGCSVGTLYKRFRNKEALLEVFAEAARQEIAKEIETGLAAEVEKTSSLLELTEIVVFFIAAGLKQREMLMRALLVRHLTKPGAMFPLQQAARQVIDFTLEISRPYQPDHLSDEEYERRFRIAFQMIIGTIINMIVNQPGPIFLDSEGIGKDLSFAAVSYLQVKTEP